MPEVSDKLLPNSLQLRNSLITVLFRLEKWSGKDFNVLIYHFK
ncbi:hypothetical protein GRFL_0365 [Christiangramia flava JLT2011]|uniref:Uncharacterized protein n=1 Tax=Christiangramia flava JLT2011 TaxID=1229726 RepID=A0A1L7I0G5_9FLAO|nr:hypothetical protein GRFL_0365 [Christiangramia flava JLT2011]